MSPTPAFGDESLEVRLRVAKSVRPRHADDVEALRAARSGSNAVEIARQV